MSHHHDILLLRLLRLQIKTLFSSSCNDDDILFLSQKSSSPHTHTHTHTHTHEYKNFFNSVELS